MPEAETLYDIMLLKRGPKVRLPQLHVGEVAFLTDIKKFAVGTLDGNYIIDEDVVFVGRKIFPTFTQQQTAESFYYRDVGPVRHFVLSKFKLYKKDENNLEATADISVDMGTFIAPIGQSFVSIDDKMFMLSLVVKGNKVIAYTPKGIPEMTLATGAAIELSGYFQVLP